MKTPRRLRHLAPTLVFSLAVALAGTQVSAAPSYAWHTFYGSSANDRATSIARAADGSLYVTGVSGASWTGPSGQAPLNAHSGGWNIVVLKLDSSGAYVWHTFHGANTTTTQPGNAIAVDASGNAYVTGSSPATWNGPSGQAPLHAFAAASLFVLKLSSAGAYQWHTFYGGLSASGNAIAIDGSGVIVVGKNFGAWTGLTALNTPPSGLDKVVVLKLSTAGAYQWHTFYGATTDEGLGVAVGNDGAIYATGDSSAGWTGPSSQAPLHAHAGGSSNLTVLKLSSAGAYQWHTFYGASTGACVGRAISLDGSASPVVVGTSNPSWNGPSGEAPLHAMAGATGIPVLKLSSAGAYQWHTFYGGTGHEVGYGVAVDSAGGVVVAGTSGNPWTGPAGELPLHAHSGGADEMSIFALSRAGAYRWHTFYGAPSSELGTGITLDGSGSAFVAGWSWDTSWNGDGGQAPLHAFTGGWETHVLKLAGAGTSRPAGDFDGDGAADVGVFHTASGLWFIRRSSDGQTSTLGYGGPSSTPVRADYDGDGKADIAVYYEANGLWYVRQSSTGTDVAAGFGGTGYKPVPRDFDGDGRADLAVFHPASGLWFVRRSSNGLTTTLGYGSSSATPVPADYDGDGKADVAVYYEVNGLWYVRQSSTDADVTAGFGGTGYKPVPADYDGDGHADFAVFHPASGLWFVRRSSSGQITTLGYGSSSATPVPADYDGDGKADVAVYYETPGLWYLRQTSSGTDYVVGYGGNGYSPLH